MESSQEQQQNDDNHDSIMAVPVVVKKENKEAFHPLNLLLPELWDKVISHIEADSQDIINLSNTCTWFKELLHDKISVCHLDAVIPLVLKFLPMNDVLRARGVCQRVSKTIDKVLVAAEKVSIGLGDPTLFHRLIPPSYLKSRASFQKVHFMSLTGTEICLKQISDIDKFRNFLEETQVAVPGRNPIIKKKIYAAVPGDREQEIANNAVLPNENQLEPNQLPSDRMLEMFRIAADNIVYVTLKGVDLMFPSDLGKYQVMEKMLLALPKLCDFSFPCFTERTQELRNYKDVEQYIDDGHHLPNRPSLEKLAFELYRLPKCYFREVALRYSAHIKILTLSLYDDNDPLFCKETSGDENERYDFPVLKILHLSQVPWPCHPAILRISAPRLEFLNLHVERHTDQNLATSSITELAKTITNFEGLSELCLQLPENFAPPETDTASTIAALKVHNKRNLKLVDLKLNNMNGATNVPLRFFTLLCPNVESIKITMRKLARAPRDPHNCDWTKFYHRRVDTSMVWIDARKLKTIQWTEWIPWNTVNNVQYTFTRPVPESTLRQRAAQMQLD